MVKVSRRSDGGKSIKMSFKNVRYGSQKTVSKHLNANISFAFQAVQKLSAHFTNLCFAAICTFFGDFGGFLGRDSFSKD